MTLIQAQPWEVRLLLAAQEAFHSQKPQAMVGPCAQELNDAYQACKAITRQHSRTFFVASGLLPPLKRRAVRALYAFCRVSDDIIDRSDAPLNERLIELREWEQTVTSDTPVLGDPVSMAWRDTQARFHIPRGYAQQLIEGVARDVRQDRYQSFEELAEYAYGVASTVGLMAMHIIGFKSADAIHYAVRLGVALQITNILRDVGEDWRAGRLYLPLAELAEFGISEDQLSEGRVSPEWRAFMRFQIARNRQLYAESLPGIELLNSDGRFAIAAAARLYEAILSDIEAHDYDVFSRRASLSTFGKIRKLPGIWWQSRRTGHLHG